MPRPLVRHARPQVEKGRTSGDNAGAALGVQSLQAPIEVFPSPPPRPPSPLHLPPLPPLLPSPPPSPPLSPLTLVDGRLQRLADAQPHGQVQALLSPGEDPGDGAQRLNAAALAAAGAGADVEAAQLAASRKEKEGGLHS